MEHLITVVIDENEFGGRIYDDGENERYDLYTDWINKSTEAGHLVNNVHAIVKEWNEKVEIDGGSLIHPNGIMFWAHTFIPADMVDAVQQNIEAKVKTQFDLYASTSPVDMTYSVRVEEA